MRMIIQAIWTAALIGLGGVASAGAESRPAVRLYRLDCGTMHVDDMSVLSDAGLYKGRSLDVVVSCYLIKHGKTWLLWDAGLSRDFLPGVRTGILYSKLTVSIPEQLRAIGLNEADISAVAISHAHFDHTGQVDDFPAATLIMQRADYDVLADEKTAEAHLIQLNLLQKHTAPGGHLKLIDGNYDFFGDGTVKAILLPGHTPGHMALEIRLAKAGPVILSGDQWQFAENRRNNQVPQGNFDHDTTIRSSALLNDIVDKERARLIIEHDPLDNRKLPIFPEYLD